jgi:hypothetical protein
MRGVACGDSIESAIMQEVEPKQTSAAPSIFAEPKAERGFPVAAVSIAAVAVAIVVGTFLFSGRKRAPALDPNKVQPIAAYAANLTVSNVQMSESTSLSGGKSTYLDGHIANHGPSTVTGVTVQVLFPNDQQQPPQVETVPLNVIRMREPYIDTASLSAAPLAPGAEADFRLIFEDVAESWNQQPPEVHIVEVKTR